MLITGRSAGAFCPQAKATVIKLTIRENIYFILELYIRDSLKTDYSMDLEKFIGVDAWIAKEIPESRSQLRGQVHQRLQTSPVQGVETIANLRRKILSLCLPDDAFIDFCQKSGPDCP